MKFVVEGGLFSMYDMVCPSCMCGIGVMMFFKGTIVFWCICQYVSLDVCICTKF